MVCFWQSKASFGPVRAIQFDTPLPEAYSLEAVAKHGFSKCVRFNASCMSLRTIILEEQLHWCSKSNVFFLFFF